MIYAISYIDDLVSFREWLNNAGESIAVKKNILNNKNIIGLHMLKPKYESVPYEEVVVDDVSTWVATREPNKSMSLLFLKCNEELQLLKEHPMVDVLASAFSLNHLYFKLENDTEARTKYENIWPKEIQDLYGFRFANITE